jgi:hypothetical protein
MLTNLKGPAFEFAGPFLVISCHQSEFKLSAHNIASGESAELCGE